MELDLSALHDERMERFYDVLVLYLLADSALGDCELKRRLGAALDSGDAERLADLLRYFASLPEEFQARILEGDPTLPTMLDSARGAGAAEPARIARPASA